MYTNAKRGRTREYKIIKKLKKEGWEIVQRSRGSYSPIDIWAIKKLDKKILLVQSKPKSLSDNAVEKLLEDNSLLNGKFDVEFVVLS